MVGKPIGQEVEFAPEHPRTAPVQREQSGPGQHALAFERRSYAGLRQTQNNRENLLDLQGRQWPEIVRRVVQDTLVLQHHGELKDALIDVSKAYQLAQAADVLAEQLRWPRCASALLGRGVQFPQVRAYTPSIEFVPIDIDPLVQTKRSC
jgi:hypothetical protein